MKNIIRRIANNSITNAQKWLDLSYPLKTRNQITKLNLHKKNLAGELVIRDFFELKEIDCSYNQLTKLTIQNCPLVNNLDVYENKLNQDLSFLKDLVNLEKLDLGWNSLHGSLEPLKNLSKLRELSVKATDLDSGLEYLPDSLKWFKCVYTKELAWELEDYEAYEETSFKAWKGFYKKDQQIQELKTQLEQEKQKNEILQQKLEKTLTNLQKHIQETESELGLNQKAQILHNPPKSN